MLKPQRQLNSPRIPSRAFRANRCPSLYPLIASAREGFVEVRVELARRRLFLVSAAGELRDGVPRRLRQRILRAGFHARRTAGLRAGDVGVDVPGPVSVSEYQR